MELLKPPVLTNKQKKAITSEFNRVYTEHLRQEAHDRARELAHNDIVEFFQEEAKYGNDSK
jgi:hypothetical protein